MKECNMFCGNEECTKTSPVIVLCPVCRSGRVVYSNSEFDLMCIDCGELFNEVVNG